MSTSVVDATVPPHRIPKSSRRRSFLIIETDDSHRAALEAAAREAGLQVHAVSSIGDVERWPEGEIVVTDAAHCTPWWKFVGATEVIALTRNDAEREAALRDGATRTVPLAATPEYAVSDEAPFVRAVVRTRCR
jgi:hypothetical protein